MKAGYYREDELAVLAREARQVKGVSQKDVESRLKQEGGRWADLSAPQPVVSMAESRPDRPYTSLRIAMIEAFSEYEVTGPFYLLKPKRKD